MIGAAGPVLTSLAEITQEDYIAGDIAAGEEQSSVIG
jgi:hypothetical protein